MEHELKKINLLLIEDNEGDIFLIKEVLDESTMIEHISIATDGEKAIDYLVNEKNTLPNLIVLDINLPKITGHEVLKTIKANERCKQIPVIILSTSSNERDIRESYQNFASGYLVKPTEAGSFFRTIELIESFWTQFVRFPNGI